MKKLSYEVLMDKKENPRKCTIAPLKDRTDFKIRYFQRNMKIPAFQTTLLLHIDGISLDEFAKSSMNVESIGVIDCTWKKVEGALSRLEKPFPMLARIPNGFLTAYPRKNAHGLDPDAGLATIEAIFIAAAFCGQWDESLLEHYHFGKDFLKINAPLWGKYALAK